MINNNVYLPPYNSTLDDKVLRVNSSGILEWSYTKMMKLVEYAVSADAGESYLDITGISSTLYSSLIIFVSCRSKSTSSTSDTLYMRFNNNTDSEYLYQSLFCGNTTVTGSATISNGFPCGACNAEGTGNFSDCFSEHVIRVPHCNSSDILKMYQSESFASPTSTSVSKYSYAGTLRNLKDPISSIRLFPASGNFAKYSRLKVYAER